MALVYRRPALLLIALVAGGCSLLSLDELQGGSTSGGPTTSGPGSSTSTSPNTTSGASSESTSSGSGVGGESSTASASGSTSSSAAGTGGGGGGVPGDTQYVAEVTADGPTAWYRLGESSSLMAAKDEAAGQNGVYEGGLTMGVPSPFTNTTDTAVAFSTGWMHADYPGLAVYDGASSFEAWIKVAMIDTVHRGIIDVEWDASGSKEGYRMYAFTFGGVPKITYGRVKPMLDQDLTVTYPNDGLYHHVVGTYDGGTAICIYIDAVGTCTNATKITFANNAATGVVVGTRTSDMTDLFKGTIDEVALYDKVLTQARVSAHYNAKGP